MTPPDCDLRGMPFMPLDVQRLRDSDLALVATGDEFKAAVLLWCAAWHQIPAGSLPADDRALCKLSGLDAKAWKRAREGALRGWEGGDDGRLYHAVVSEKAAKAWEQRKRFRNRREKDRERLSEWREKRALKRVSDDDGNDDETSKTGDRGEGDKNPPYPPSKGGREKSDRRKPKTAIPDGFPTAEAIAEQQQRARIDGADIDVAYQAERFRNWALGADARYADWNATWRNWVGKAIKEPPGLRFGGQPPARQAAPAPESETPDLWRMRLRQWRSDVPWNEVTWGPPPGQPHCRCPADLLSPSERRGDGPGSAP